MPVSHTSARSRLSSPALSRTKPNRCFEPHSSSPSIIMVMSSGSFAGDRLEGAASLDEGHGLAFVVAGAARDDDLPAAVERLDARLERRRLPQIERIDRLHVVMAVEQDARRLPLGRSVAAFATDSCRSRPDGRRSGARWSRTRGCGGRRRRVRPRCGNAAHRPGRSRSTEFARARTTDPDCCQDRHLCDRAPIQVVTRWTLRISFSCCAGSYSPTAAPAGLTSRLRTSQASSVTRSRVAALRKVGLGWLTE